MSNLCDIRAFAERDIDVWLAEELRFNSSFCRWFLDAIGVDASVMTPANKVRLSVVDPYGRETDVEAVFSTATGGEYVVLIENKINAAFQPNQMEDYVLRLEHGLRMGAWAGGRVAVFAPSHRSLGAPPGVQLVSFGDAVRMLERLNADDRAQYRTDFLRRANAPGVTEAVTQAQIDFWRAVNGMVRREFADCLFADHQSYPRQSWINPRWHDMPAYLRLDLKGLHGEVDLAFKNVPFEAFSKGVSSLLPIDMGLIENGKSSAIRIAGLQRFNVGDGVVVVDTHVRDAYCAARRLLEFWRQHRAVFDGMAITAQGK